MAAGSQASRQRSYSKRFVVLSWVCVVGWACFIFFMSSNSGDGLNEGLGFFSRIYGAMKVVQVQLFGEGVDVLSPLAHFCEYTVFGVLWVNALRCHMPLRRAVVLAVVCSSLYGVTDEIHQIFVPDRMSDPLDWLTDTAGATLGATLTWLTLRKYV